MTAEVLYEKILEAGIVGAGGAGFPTHVKLVKDMEYLIINGVECEPLLYTDYHILDQYTERLLWALSEILSGYNIKQGIIGIKAKNQLLIEKLTQQAHLYPNIAIKTIANVYPVGDEVTLIHECIGKVVPVGALPSTVGTIVMNVETLLNVGNKLAEDINVTHTYITVGGEVEEPIVLRVPIGCTVSDLLGMVKLMLPKEAISVLVGGPMMGDFGDFNTVISKKTKAIIFLPSNHSLHTKKAKVDWEHIKRIMGCCSQCRMCTDMCPRNRLGHQVHPHQVMNAFANGIKSHHEGLLTAVGCCGCNVCSYYACHHGLRPSQLMTMIKKEIGRPKMDMPQHKGHISDLRLPSKNLLLRLGLKKYDKVPRFEHKDVQPLNIFIPTSQHVGAPAQLQVNTGDSVKQGECIGEIPSDKLGAKVHASVDGVIIKSDQACVVIRTNQ